MIILTKERVTKKASTERKLWRFGYFFPPTSTAVSIKSWVVHEQSVHWNACEILHSNGLNATMQCIQKYQGLYSALQWKYQVQAPSIACSIDVYSRCIRKSRSAGTKPRSVLGIFCFLYSAVCLCNRICATLFLWFGFFILMGTASASWEILTWATTQMHTTHNTQHTTHSTQHTTHNTDALLCKINSCTAKNMLSGYWTTDPEPIVSTMIILLSNIGDPVLCQVSLIWCSLCIHSCGRVCLGICLHFACDIILYIGDCSSLLERSLD